MEARGAMTRAPFDPARIEAVAFDLLTALIDSWSLWIGVAGAAVLGRAWRRASLRRVTGAGAYRRYEDILREATAEVGLPPARSACRSTGPTASACRCRRARRRRSSMHPISAPCRPWWPRRHKKSPAALLLGGRRVEGAQDLEGGEEVGEDGRTSSVT